MNGDVLLGDFLMFVHLYICICIFTALTWNCIYPIFEFLLCDSCGVLLGSICWNALWSSDFFVVCYSFTSLLILLCYLLLFDIWRINSSMLGRRIPSFENFLEEDSRFLVYFEFLIFSYWKLKVATDFITTSNILWIVCSLHIVSNS